MEKGDEYMLLDLDQVGVKELCYLLLHRNIGGRTFINSHDDDGLNGTFFRRFLIFVSIVLITALKSIAGLMASLGRFIEWFLNLWSYYGNFSILVFNTLRGKNVKLCHESSDFSSFAGLLDTRVELDEDILRDDPRYVSALAIMAAKTAYENEARVKKIVQDHWKMEYVGFYHCSNAFETKLLTEKKRPTQAFIFIDKTGDHDVIYVTFRGTSPFSADDWCTDLDFSWYRLPGIGKVHMGFMKALGLQKNTTSATWPKQLDHQHSELVQKTFAYYKIREVLKQLFKQNENARFVVTGHSLGGALAVLFPAILRFHDEFELLERLEGVYTFGQPRVGDGEFCGYMDDLLGAKRYFRFVYGYDVIPRVPFDDSDLMFKHFGYCYYFNSFYKGQVMNEEPNKNYFWPSSILPIYLNAIFEVVRSAILPYAFGRTYKEGILLFGVRLFGLVFPGIASHSPPDYVNLTRLGSPDTFYTIQEDYVN